MSAFMGYGSPEKLNAAITAEEDEAFVVYSEGLLFASVCSNLPQEEVESRMRRRINGTTGGWNLSDENFSGGESNPCQCTDHEDRKHYLFVT